jgi:NAD(P)-dependent dehydrogenase (short-subunit alcohol dehydrogenase family)
LNRTILITGACGGIGRALCARFVTAGDTVLALDHDHDALRLFAATLPGCIAVDADLTDGAGTRAAIELAMLQSGPVEVLVANAGAACSLTLASTSTESWQRDIDLNLNGSYRTVSAVLPGMIERGKGSIVLIGSVNGITALGHPAYSAAKAGMISYTRSLAIEYGRHGIRANIVCPGTVKTPAWQARIDKAPQVMETLKKWYPLGDFATPDDIADAVQFLASDAARVITGVVLPVDGGLMAGNRVMAQELTLEEF